MVLSLLSQMIDFATSGTWSSDGSATGHGNTVYYKRILPNIVFLWGVITPTQTNNNITLPFTSPLSSAQTWILYAGGMTATKAYIPANSNTIGFAQNSGGSFALNAFAILA